MKPQSRRRWKAAAAGHAHNIKVRMESGEWPPRPDTLAGNHPVETSMPADHLTEQELMIWSDDGGTAGAAHRTGD